MKKSVMFSLLVFAVFVFGFVSLVSASSNVVLTNLAKTQNDTAISFCVKNIGNVSSLNFTVMAQIKSRLNSTYRETDVYFIVGGNSLLPNQQECKTQYLNASDSLGMPHIDSYLLNSFESKSDSVILNFRVYGINPSAYGVMDLNQTPYNNTLTYSWSDIYDKMSNADLRGTMYYNNLNINQINQNLSKFLILENISSWSFNNGSGLINTIPAFAKGNGFSENYTIYEASYNYDGETANVQVVKFPSRILNRNFLEQFIKSAVENKFVNIQSKTFDNQTYLYVESPVNETQTTSPLRPGGGVIHEYLVGNYFWYNGDKVVYVSFKKDYPTNTGELLRGYMDKYPSEVTASQGFIEAIVNFFRNLFGVR